MGLMSRSSRVFILCCLVAATAVGLCAQLRAHETDQHVKELGPDADLNEYHTPGYIVPLVNAQIPWAMDVIEGWEHELHSQGVRDKYPGRVVGFKEPFKNIMQHTHFFL